VGGKARARDARSSDAARLWRADDLGGLEVMRASYVSFVFTPHAHEGFMIALTEGGVGGPVFRGEMHPVGPGDVIVLNPEEAHAGGPATEAAWRYRAIYPSTDLLRQATSELEEPGPGAPEFTEDVVRDLDLARRLRSFHEITERADSTALERESHLVEALAGLVSRHATRPGAEGSLGHGHRGVRKAREYLDEHAVSNVSLTEVARAAGLSPYHLCRVFRRDVGLTPHAYQTQVRVRQAGQLLRDGTPIALTAIDSGFYDQAHLTKAFKRVTGVTPGEYVRAGGDRLMGSPSRSPLTRSAA
jgi:AraC-like DNA-binding protein